MIKKIIQKAAGVLRHPSGTFRKLKDETFRDAVNYYLILFGINLVLSAVITFRLGEMDMKALTDPAALSILGKAFIAIGYVGFIRSLFFGTVGLVIFSILFHVPVSRAGGSKGLKTTLSVVMYSLTPLLLTGWLFNLLLAFFKGLSESLQLILFQVIPLYLLLMFVYTMALLYYGIQELHEISSEQAFGAVAITTAALFVFAFFAIIFLIAASLGAGMMSSFESMKPH